MQWRELKNEQSSSSLEPASRLELSVNQFNKQPQKIITTWKIFDLNIIILTKCIILNYLTKINLCPYSI